jgi:hypothetical protein
LCLLLVALLLPLLVQHATHSELLPYPSSCSQLLLLMLLPLLLFYYYYFTQYFLHYISFFLCVLVLATLWLISALPSLLPAAHAHGATVVTDGRFIAALHLPSMHLLVHVVLCMQLTASSCPTLPPAASCCCSCC